MKDELMKRWEELNKFMDDPNHDESEEQSVVDEMAEIEELLEEYGLVWGEHYGL